MASYERHTQLEMKCQTVTEGKGNKYALQIYTNYSLKMSTHINNEYLLLSLLAAEADGISKSKPYCSLFSVCCLPIPS